MDPLILTVSLQRYPSFVVLWQKDYGPLPLNHTTGNKGDPGRGSLCSQPLGASEPEAAAIPSSPSSSGLAGARS